MSNKKRKTTLTVELDFPVNKDGKEVNSITFGLPTVKQLMYVEKIKETEGDAAAGLHAMSASTGLAGDMWTIEDLEGLYAPDFGNIGEHFINFTQGLEIQKS